MQKGFSLLELLIAIGITAGITVVIAQSFITTSRGNIKTELRNSIKQSGDFSLQMMERYIRSSDMIVSACDGTPTKEIQVKNVDNGITTFGCVFDEDNGINRIASTSGSGTVDYITPTSVTLGGASCTAQGMTLVFTCQSTPGLNEEVTVNFRLSQPGTPVSTYEQSSVPFEMTVARRN
jgi:prepilin-type N-terminal cleavage/methylation domain-containing protein